MARINDYVANLKPQTGERIHIDEQSIQIGKDNEWCWNSLDNRSRFLLATQITKVRRIKDARSIIQKTKSVISQSPTEIATDKGQFYKKAVRKEFPTHARLFVPERLRDKPHERVYHMTKKVDNQLIERYHATFRERDKVIRGFKSEKTAEAFIDNWRTYYNFVKPHMTFNGLTPSEVAGINIGRERNKWLSLIKLSSQNNIG